MTLSLLSDSFDLQNINTDPCSMKPTLPIIDNSTLNENNVSRFIDPEISVELLPSVPNHEVIKASSINESGTVVGLALDLKQRLDNLLESQATFADDSSVLQFKLNKNNDCSISTNSQVSLPQVSLIQLNELVKSNLSSKKSNPVLLTNFKYKLLELRRKKDSIETPLDKFNFYTFTLNELNTKLGFNFDLKLLSVAGNTGVKLSELYELGLVKYEEPLMSASVTQTVVLAPGIASMAGSVTLSPRVNRAASQVIPPGSPRLNRTETPAPQAQLSAQRSQPPGSRRSSASSISRSRLSSQSSQFQQQGYATTTCCGNQNCSCLGKRSMNFKKSQTRSYELFPRLEVRGIGYFKQMSNGTIKKKKILKNLALVKQKIEMVYESSKLPDPSKPDSLKDFKKSLNTTVSQLNAQQKKNPRFLILQIKVLMK
jgi:hypothetical protein